MSNDVPMCQVCDDHGYVVAGWEPHPTLGAVEVCHDCHCCRGERGVPCACVPRCACGEPVMAPGRTRCVECAFDFLGGE